MNNRVFFGLLFLAAAVIMVWFAFQGKPLPFGSTDKATTTNTSTFPTQSPQENSGESVEGPSGLDKGGVAARTVVTYTDTGFGPASVTVSIGSTVTFINESSRGMWAASGVHPTHQLLPGFDQLSQAPKGGTYEYTFTKVGTWKYHNHLNPTDTATIVVK